MRRIMMNFADDDLDDGLVVDGDAKIAGIFLPANAGEAIRLRPVTRRSAGNVVTMPLRSRLKTGG